MNKTLSGIIIASAVCAMFAGKAGAQEEKGEKMKMPESKKATGVSCQGHNDCKGHGGCKGEANSCKGQNDCANHAFRAASKKGCKQAKGDAVEEKKDEKKTDKHG